MGTGQSKPVPVTGTSVTSVTSVTPVTSPVKTVPKVNPQPVQQVQPVKPKETQIQRNMTKLTDDEKVKQATEKMLTVESLIMTATVAGIAESIVKATLAAGGIIAVANPVVAPALAGVAIIAAAYLRLKAGHMELITNLQLKSSKYIKLMNLVCIAETVYRLMVNSDKNTAKKAELEKFEMNTRAIKQYAELFRIQILLSAPDKLLKELEKAMAITNKNYAKLNERSLLSKKSVGSFSSWFDRKSTFGSLYGDVTRVLQSKQMILSINRALDDLFLEIQIMLDRYDEFTRVYRQEYDNIAIEFTKTPEFQLLLTGSDEKVSDSLTPEEAAKHLEDAAKNLAAVGINAEKPTVQPTTVNTIITVEVKEGEVASTAATQQVAKSTGLNPEVLENSVNVAQNSNQKTEILAIAVVDAAEAKTPVVPSPTINNTSKPSVVPIVNIPNKRNNVTLKGNNVTLKSKIPNTSNIPIKGINPITSEHEPPDEDPVTYTSAPMVAAGGTGGSRKKKKRCRSKTVRRRKRRN